MTANILHLLHDLAAYTLDPLWVPLGIWTIAALSVPGLLRLGTPSPLVNYRVRQALLFALPLGLVLGAVTDWTLPLLSEPLSATASVVFAPSVVVPSGSPPDASIATALTWLHALGLVTLGGFLLAAWRLLRLAASAVRLVRFRRLLPTEASDAACEAAQTTAHRLGIRRPFRLARAPHGLPPMTLGPFRPIITLPTNLDDDQQEMALTHELIHLRRHDDRTASGEALIAALFFAHPLCAYLRRTIAEARETACDAALLNERGFSPRRYAQLLLNLTAPVARQRQDPSLALSLAAPRYFLPQRLRAMKDRPSPAPRLALFSSTALLFLFLLLMAGLGLNTPAEPAGPASSPGSHATPPQAAPAFAPSVTPDTTEFSEVDEKPKIVGGPQALYENLRYPEAARADSLEGTVYVQFVVDKDGNVREANVLKGPAESLNQAGLRAVRALTFRPGKENGEPVPVRMTQPIRFRL